MNRALLVGINEYPSSPLEGCVNDVTDMANFLVSRCGFALSEIRLLTDKRATRNGIVDRVNWLLRKVKKGDRILFHYSGHGAQLPTRNPSGEVDGLDEVICPVDFDWTDEHTIRDKDFVKLFKNVPEGVEFIWISDSCHSGDLSRAIPPKGKKEKRLIAPADIQWRRQTALCEKSIEPLTMVRAGSLLQGALISGCRSDQTSADAYFNKKPNGALTYFLLKELQKTNGLKAPLAVIIKNVRKSLKGNKFSQVPQLEGSSVVLQKPFMVI